MDAEGESVTHQDLCRRAVRWLKGTKRCGVVFSEVEGWGEIADVIGWRLGGVWSTLVEVKTSRGDFLRDRKKSHRKLGMGMGRERFYLAPRGLIAPDELVDGWGLIVPACSQIRVLRKAVPRPLTVERLRREIDVLFSAERKRELGIPVDWLHREAQNEVSRGC